VLFYKVPSRFPVSVKKGIISSGIMRQIQAP
ncbi:MAG: hypothetical protein ACI836_000458, partial [Saprospiraceae bacterium]